MILKIQEFEEFAKRRGKTGREIIEEMGSSESAYRFFKRGGRIGSDLVAELYNRFGEEAIFKFIDFEEDGGNGFKSKYVQVGSKLY